MADSPLAQPTERLGERYALYGEIASGGMATVHFGRLLGPVGFSRTVAIKRLHLQYASEPEFVGMFVDEARLAARVRHPNVVATIDVIHTEGQLYLVMEYVQGESLRRLWKTVQEKGGRIPRRIVCSIILGVLHGLHAAHEAKNEKGEPLGIVHRDVSPQNVLVGTDGIARVIDFGIAKAAVRLQTTSSGQMKGKPAYMAPEQILDKGVTRQTDVYAASVMFWEMLTGSRLFWAKNDAEIIANVLKRPVDRPSARVPSLLPALDDIVLKGLARDPAHRYATAREMAKAIEDCIAPASASDVGEWVERIGGDVLRSRERRLKEIEEGTASPVSVPSIPREAALSEPSPGTPIGHALPTVPPSIKAPDLIIPTREEVPVSKARAALASNAPTLTRDISPDLSPESAGGGYGGRQVEFDSLSGEGPTLEVDAPEYARTISMPGRMAPGYVGRVIESQPPPRQPKRRIGSVWMLALTVVTATFAIGVWWLPEYLLGRMMKAAAEQGLHLSVQRLGVRPRAILLDGVRITATDIPGLSITAAEASVSLSGMHAQGVSARSFELVLSGGVDDLVSKVAAWRAKHALDALPVSADAGHVTWTAPLGDGTQLEAWDVAAQLAPHATARDEVHLVASSIMVRVPRGSLGPWRVTYDRDAKGARLDAAFDPAVPEWATARILEPKEGTGSVSLSIPPSPIQRVGLSPDLLAPLGDPSLQVEARLDVAAASEDRYEGKATLALLNVRSGHGRLPTPLRLDATLGGGTSEPLAVNGVLTVGASKGPLTGIAAGVADGFRTDLTWKVSPAPCVDPAVDTPRPANGHHGHAPPAPPATVALTYDSGDLGASGAKGAPPGCVLGLFVAP